jgi:hypothetical protein
MSGEENKDVWETSCLFMYEHEFQFQSICLDHLNVLKPQSSSPGVHIISLATGYDLIVVVLLKCQDILQEKTRRLCQEKLKTYEQQSVALTDMKQ